MIHSLIARRPSSNPSDGVDQLPQLLNVRRLRVVPFRVDALTPPGRYPVQFVPLDKGGEVLTVSDGAVYWFAEPVNLALATALQTPIPGGLDGWLVTWTSDLEGGLVAGTPVPVGRYLGNWHSASGSAIDTGPLPVDEFGSLIAVLNVGTPGTARSLNAAIRPDGSGADALQAQVAATVAPGSAALFAWGPGAAVAGGVNYAWPSPLPTIVRLTVPGVASGAADLYLWGR